MTPNIVIVDLDGTLCNSAHREHLARAGEWEAFHSLLMEDLPWPDVQKLIEVINGDPDMYNVIGLTGRNERYRTMTMSWLAKNSVELDELLMRPDNDYRSDAELKPQLLDEWLDKRRFTHADVWFILEDRDVMVETWRNLGHSCLQPRPGGY